MIRSSETLQYTELFINTCCSYQERPDVEGLIETLTVRVNTRHAAELWKGFRRGNVPDMLELALRYASCIPIGVLNMRRV